MIRDTGVLYSINSLIWARIRWGGIIGIHSSESGARNVRAGGSPIVKVGKWGILECEKLNLKLAAWVYSTRQKKVCLVRYM